MCELHPNKKPELMSNNSIALHLLDVFLCAFEFRYELPNGFASMISDKSERLVDKLNLSGISALMTSAHHTTSCVVCLFIAFVVLAESVIMTADEACKGIRQFRLPENADFRIKNTMVAVLMARTTEGTYGNTQIQAEVKPKYKPDRNAANMATDDPCSEQL
ncbi:hypothetical protein AB6A40_007203 [Gnathostoma spinigerum]|uniref:Uncharacterized protein n=1 Tax=Gnathostoma spinigerum TaxID=75299 RepID=A0ABD6ET71_9BILA